MRSELVPWPDGITVRGRTPFVTPWRVVLITDRAGGLIESNLILNLNEPCALEDTSWIRPMKYVGIWWAMHVERATRHEGPEHGATTENARRAIDENARELDVPLAFLEPGVLHVARNFADGPDAAPEARPESVEIREERVMVADTITLSLAPGGGQAIWFAPAP